MRGALIVALAVIAPRAVVVWALTRLLLAAIPLSGGAAFGSLAPPPIAVALLAGILGLVDVRVRGERLLWANLGVHAGVLFACHVAVALPAEALLALALALR